jgi:hypothetical protein
MDEKRILALVLQAVSAPLGDQLKEIRSLRRDVTMLRNQMALLRVQERGRRSAELRAQVEADDE